MVYIGEEVEGSQLARMVTNLVLLQDLEKEISILSQDQGGMLDLFYLSQSFYPKFLVVRGGNFRNHFIMG